MKPILRKTLTALILLLYAIGLFGQDEEGKFVFSISFWYGPTNNRSIIVRFEDNSEFAFNITNDGTGDWGMVEYFHKIPEQIVLSTPCGDFTQAYRRGAMDGTGESVFHETCPGSIDINDGGEFWIEGPAIIQSVQFVDSNSERIDFPYACPDAQIKIEIEDHGVSNDYRIQCANIGGDWHTIRSQQKQTDHPEHIPFSAIQDAGVDPYQRFVFRTERNFSMGGASASTSTSTTELRYIPQFRFPAGKELIVETPRCTDEATKLKIPCQDNINYVITLIDDSDGSGKLNTTTDLLATELIDGTTYYLATIPLSSGQYTLKIASATEGCEFVTAFAVAEIPPFSIANLSFPDLSGGYEIPIPGQKGRVVMNVSGSRDSTVMIHAGTESFRRTLTASSQTGGSRYYSGSVSIELAAGEYDIRASNLFCTSNIFHNVILNAPDSIHFTLIPHPPSCNEASLMSGSCDNGRIEISGISGGYGTYSYRINNRNAVVVNNPHSVFVTGLLAGDYSITVSDSDNENIHSTQSVSLTAPAPIAVTYTAAAPTMACVADGRLTLSASGGNEAGYMYGKTRNSLDLSPVLTGLASGRDTVYVKDANNCMVKVLVEVPPAASPLRIASETSIAPRCNGEENGRCVLLMENVQGELTVKEAGASFSVAGDTITISGLASGTYSCRIVDKKDGVECEIPYSWTIPDTEAMTVRFVDFREQYCYSPHDVSICTETQGVAGNYTYLWSTGDTTACLTNVHTGSYWVQVSDANGCSAWADIEVVIGNNALSADLLLASEAVVGDTLVIFELSNLPLDSLHWEYEPAVFERIEPQGDYAGLAYVLMLRCLQTGVYDIGLHAYLGGCYAPVVKQLEVLPENEAHPDEWLSHPPLISWLRYYPNPSRGQFTVELELREKIDIQLFLFDTASGVCVDRRTERDSDRYRIEYNVQRLNTGIYILMLTAGNERKQLKLLIE